MPDPLMQQLEAIEQRWQSITDQPIGEAQNTIEQLARKVRQMQTALVQASGVLKLVDTQGRTGVDMALRDIQVALAPLED